MEEKTMLKAAMIIAIIGIATLYVVMENTDYYPVEIKEIVSEDEGTDIKISGQVLDVQENEKIAIVEIGEYKLEKVKVVVFKDKDSDDNEYDGYLGREAVIRGELQDNRYEKEVIADSIELVNDI